MFDVVVPPWTAELAKKTLTLVRWTSSLHGSLFPHLSVSYQFSDAAINEIKNFNLPKYILPILSFVIVHIQNHMLQLVLSVL